MNTKTFNENYTIDRKSRGVKALPKNAYAESVEIITADGAAYDPNTTYYFFDEQSSEVRQSVGLRRDGDYLCTFGLKVAPISGLHANRADALADGQRVFKSQIKQLQTRIENFELEKAVGSVNV
jgi:hypothetical protein